MKQSFPGYHYEWDMQVLAESSAFTCIKSLLQRASVFNKNNKFSESREFTTKVSLNALIRMVQGVKNINI